MKSIIFLTCLALPFLVVSCNRGSRDQISTDRNRNLKLWYTTPAAEWVEALPVGNGRLGAMVFGRTCTERIQLNEESLWAGRRVNSNNPNALANLGQIRELLLQHRNAEALELAERSLVSTPPDIRSYQTLGDLYLGMAHEGVSEFYRDLNLQTGVATVRYQSNQGRFRREVFVSAPHDAIVVNIVNEDNKPFDMTIRLERIENALVVTDGNNSLAMRGQIIDDKEPWRGPLGEHMRFHAQLEARNSGGSITARDDSLIAQGVNELTILLTAVTDYNLDKLCFDRSINPEEVARQILSRLRDKPYTQIKEAHVANHRRLFDRVSLSLGINDTIPDMPTNQRLARVQAGATDPFLEELMFQYGRYLLMGSSRAPGRLPANLQGIWNEHINAPWESDFHVNINLQMNYWPAEVGNLPETVKPLLHFFDRLRVPGRETAREMYNARGWAMHHLTDAFGRTALMNAIRWGTFPMGGAWMCLPLWKHYQFNPQDVELLRDSIYPIMKESAVFVKDFLIECHDGYLVTAPSYSPENAFIDPVTGAEIKLTYAATMDVQIIRELFNACIMAAKIVGETDTLFVNNLSRTLERLPPVRIGENGTIQEWIKDYTEAEPGHRHISHLFGLHPGSQIGPEHPEMFNAARQTIERRLAHGGGHTGWSRAWIINMYARLLDGQQAYYHLQALLARATLTNLFGTHPPFQIDGNFGGMAGIAEMLIQSHHEEIVLLPALPTEWSEGYAKGLKARGGFEIEMRWQNGEITRLRVKSLAGKPLNIRAGNFTTSMQTRAGEWYEII